MAFALGVEDASGFYKYLINVIVVTASVAWLLLLFFRSIDSKVYREFKPFSIAMSLQLLFVTIRNLTTLLLSSVSTLLHCHFYPRQRPLAPSFFFGWCWNATVPCKSDDFLGFLLSRRKKKKSSGGFAFYRYIGHVTHRILSTTIFHTTLVV